MYLVKRQNKLLTHRARLRGGSRGGVDTAFCGAGYPLFLDAASLKNPV